MADDIDNDVTGQVAEQDGRSPAIDDVHADVRAAIASLQDDAVETPGADTERESTTPDLARGADGKFIAKEAAPVEAADPAATQVLPSTDDTTKASVEQPSTAASVPPVSWTADAKAAWSALPPAIQAAVAKREQEVSTGFRQKSDDIRRYEAAIAPIAQESQRAGLSTEQGIQRLIDGHRFLETQPVEAIQWLAQRHGIDLAQLASNPSAVQRAQVDPVVSRIMHAVPNLEQRLMQIEIDNNLNLVGSFAKSHPYFAEVEDKLPDLINEVRATNPGLRGADILDAAYERAVWLTPEVRSKLIAEQSAEAEKARAAAMTEKSEKARRAAVSIKGSSSPATAMPRASADGTVYDDVRAAIAQLSA